MGLDRNPAQRPAERPRCPVCRRFGCRGHEPFDRCSALVDGNGQLVIDLRGGDASGTPAGHARDAGRGPKHG